MVLFFPKTPIAFFLKMGSPFSRLTLGYQNYSIFSIGTVVLFIWIVLKRMNSRKKKKETEKTMKL